MTPERQRIAIAEACGWSRHIERCMGEAIEIWLNKKYPGKVSLPDYLNDLNAMHEAEQYLVRPDVIEWERYLRFLGFNHEMLLGDAWWLITATAAQRAKAFLRTIGKWEDKISSPGSEQNMSGGAARPKQGEV